jgi:hypothetical protein
MQTTPWAGFNIPPAYYLSTIFRFPLKAPKAAKKNLPRKKRRRSMKDHKKSPLEAAKTTKSTSAAQRPESQPRKQLEEGAENGHKQLQRSSMAGQRGRSASARRPETKLTRW